MHPVALVTGSCDLGSFGVSKVAFLAEKLMILSLKTGSEPGRADPVFSENLF